MKKHLSLLLALCLVLGLSLPAAAESDTADSRLAEVTLQVKETLDLDTTGYDDFYGELEEGALASRWYLDWSGEDGSLVINASEDGKILSYYLYSYSGDDSDYDSGPSFPEGDIDSARQAALDFLGKVLDSSLESATIESEYGDDLNSDSYRFSGTILLNGISSPLSFSIAVRGSDHTVTRFYRDDISEDHMGGVPSASPATTADQAEQLLKTTLALRLEYVLDDSGTAVLRYLPEYGDEYYVDAQTGELINLTELYEKLNENRTGELYGTTADTAEQAMNDNGTGSSLTEAEQTGVDKLEGVLSKTELDAMAKAITPLNLSGYTLGSAYYYVGEEDESGQTPVSVTLRYAKQTENSVQSRTVTLNGRTGELENLYGYAYSLNEEALTASVDKEKAQKLAEDFLTSYYGENFAKTALYFSSELGEDDYSATFTYCQTVNGYFYTGNYFTVEVDLTDGSIQSFDSNFDEEITFDSADGIVDEATALDAYLAFYDTALGYLSVPTEIDFTQPQYKPLIDMGYSYLYTLTLGYALDSGDSYLEGIDAKTGEAITSTWDEEETPMTYDDLEGHWVQSMAETLASYQVGFDGGSFLPDQAITQVELLDLLVSSYGSHYDISDPEEVEWLYSNAYSMGILTSAERDDTASITRAELVKMLMDAAGYRKVASLEDIFSPGFADDDAIPDGYAGYVALAKGFQLVQGDAAGCFRPDDYATRAESVAMLFRYMSF